jgi:hypothetical protein
MFKFKMIVDLNKFFYPKTHTSVKFIFLKLYIYIHHACAHVYIYEIHQKNKN